MSVKPKIGIFGRMNAGKSSLMNLLTGTSSAIVSPTPGTTTDPVRRAFELLDFGPVVFIDTAGFDDFSTLGRQRVARTINTLHEVDLVLFIPLGKELDEAEEEFLTKAEKPYIVVEKPFKIDLLDRIKEKLSTRPKEPDFFGGRIVAGDRVLLVCPIDSEAPAGKLIMPQITAIRAAIDLHAVAIVVQPEELDLMLEQTHPKLVITDSQAFGSVEVTVAKYNVELTSFSILLSEIKGDPIEYKKGLDAVQTLEDGAKILLIEHCSHQTSCDDIARVKIPMLLQKHTGKRLSFTVIGGREPMPSDLDQYSLTVQCGGCVATRGAILSRVEQCRANGLPITNYGMLLHLVQSK